MALAKFVSKLLLAASASKGRLIAVTWYFMFAFGLIYVCNSALEWPGVGHYLSQTRISAGAPNCSCYLSHVLGHYESQA